jgi:ABC-type lipoprotein export system ATPase subunit
VTASNDPMIRTVSLAKTYGSAASPVHALRGVTVSIARAEKVALVGKSGSGKSTLLNLLGGLDRPTAGSIEIGGRDLARLTSNQLAHHRLDTVGMVFQSFNLVPSRTALQNVELPMVFAGRSGVERRQAARQALEIVGLAERLQHRPSELSGGEHQRVAIARALVNHPAILLADEPTGNLDSITSTAIMETLLAYVKQHGTTLVLVTHDEELAARIADRILRLHDGNLVNV